MDPVRFGVNYTPRKNWFYSWMDWDGDSVREDLAAIASLGMDHIRAHCLWPLFQYGEARFSETALSRLDRLIGIAGDCGLDVVVTALDGFMSGFRFLPFFAHKQHMKEENFFADAHMRRAEQNFFGRLYETALPHRNFLGFDLGNELNCNADFGMDISDGVLDRWSSELFAYLEQLCPGKLLCNGVDHMSYFTDEAFSRTGHANSGNVTALHTWLGFTGALARYGYDTEPAFALPEYMIELARAYQQTPKPVWVQELGASRDWMPEDAIPAFIGGTVRHILSCENVYGVTWWCSHDVDPGFSELNHMEFSLGLLDRENHPKPEARALSEVIRQTRRAPVQPVSRPVALVADESLFVGNGPSALPQDYPGWELGSAFMRLLKEGVSPAIVTRSDAGNPVRLKQRGIRQLIEISDTI